MKKLALVCLMVAVLAGSACADYYWYGGMSTTSGQNTTATLFGYRAASTSKTLYSASPTTNQGLLCVGEYSGTAIDGSTVNPEGDFAATAYKAYRTMTPSDPWILLGFNETLFPTEGGNRVAIWGGSTLPTVGMNLYLLYNAASTEVAGIAAGEWGAVKLNTTPILGATAGSAASPWFSYDLPIVRTNTPNAGGTYVFGFTAGEMSVPEPGSMVAMLSGLVGLVGFGIRRRR